MKKLIIFIIIVIFAWLFAMETIDDQQTKFAAQAVTEIRNGYCLRLERDCAKGDDVVCLPCLPKIRDESIAYVDIEAGADNVKIENCTFIWSEYDDEGKLIQHSTDKELIHEQEVEIKVLTKEQAQGLADEYGLDIEIVYEQAEAMSVPEIME